ncbi:hypothetical protein KVT40_002778 [Elsinoe batatas]|uniref:Rhodopsin domain-containing protein n=1 Tax=Elsinoe batatas TaxID=2601811 RepID=A0A8K0LAY4_9PEZI|nr:hypothetical protein KVT40_002778 [Elsinoe batatas]
MAWIINGAPALDAQSNYRKIIGAAIATSILMLMTVLLRGYVRVRIVKSLGGDDWCILISAITALGYTTGAVIQTRYGLGLPPTLYPPENIVNGLKLNYAFRFLYCIAVSFFKFALCFAYLRITTNGLAVRTYRRVIIATMAFTLTFMIYYCAVVIFACTPIQKFWNRPTPGKCLPVPMVYYSPAVITIIVDIVLFLLPIPLVLPLRMNRRRKIGLIITFLLGLMTTLCSVMRLIGSIKVPKHNDPQYLIRWAIIEMNIGVISPLSLIVISLTLHYRSSRPPFPPLPLSSKAHSSANPNPTPPTAHAIVQFALLWPTRSPNSSRSQLPPSSRPPSAQVPTPRDPTATMRLSVPLPPLLPASHPTAVTRPTLQTLSTYLCLLLRRPLTSRFIAVRCPKKGRLPGGKRRDVCVGREVHMRLETESTCCYI